MQIGRYRREKVQERARAREKEGGLIWKWMFIDKLSEPERSSCCQADNPHGTSLAADAHAHISEAGCQLSSSPNTRQFIIKINASFPRVIVNLSPRQDGAGGSDVIIE